jgi:1,4-alpha-glucan branching enzyme
MAIYELHAGSWRWGDDGRPLGFRAMAEPLAAYAADLGFTHVELMPPATHPFGGSWGYQVTGYYAPDARGGSPDDLRHLVATLHDAGVGVLVDWVPAHFPRDEGGLARFDGGPLYEHWDPRKGEHPDWGTLVFDHGRNQVRNFLVANALYWLEEFRVDGLRVDAVASMLYLDYSRSHGQWEPNRYGGRENLEAIDFVRQLCDTVHGEHPGALVIAEESTAWPGVTAPTSEGGLGFDRKWNMGWMHDTLGFLERDPVHRRYHHDEMTFPMHYAFDERWVLPLSHDEVVHGKGALAAKFPGDRWQRLATLRLLYLWQWCSPGAPLLFMGGELGQEREWADDRPLDWWLADDPDHAGLSRLLRDLNHLVAGHPALWRGDGDRSLTWWLDAGDAESSVFSLARRDAETGEIVLIALNATPVPRHGYRLGVPFDGRWREVLCSDDLRYGGSGVVTGTAEADPRTPWQGQPASVLVTLPPLAGTVWAFEAESGRGDRNGAEEAGRILSG